MYTNELMDKLKAEDIKVSYENHIPEVDTDVSDVFTGYILCQRPQLLVSPVKVVSLAMQ
jgi:hypothetical protein